MTTIIYKDGRLFTDSRVYSGGKRPLGTKNKLHRLDNGMFAASSVEIGAPERLLTLLRENGASLPVVEKLDVDALFVQDTGAVYFYSNGPGWSLLDAQNHYAIGSGASYALGALEFGATGEEAMEVAIALDIWSGYPIASLQNPLPNA